MHDAGFDAGHDAGPAQPPQKDAGGDADAGPVDAGRPVVAVPAAVKNPTVTVSCTALCDDKTCGSATVFVSACSNADPSSCYEITPVGDPEVDGNTYVVSVDTKGTAEVREYTTCTAPMDAKQGLPVDLLFVVDTTGSMAPEIKGVVDSIDKFANGLADRGVDVRLGGIAFGNVAPLANCVAPAAPYTAFTSTFGAGSASNPKSFNYWLSTLTASYCGDSGGDAPENALDAIEFALGHDPDSTDKFSANAFAWRPESLHAIVVITDVNQHQLSDSQGAAHFNLADVQKAVDGFGVVHVVGPNYACWGTAALGCTCNATLNACDTGCACDLQCVTPGCATDTTVSVCDETTPKCDPDCAGVGGSTCDVTVGRCDPDAADATLPCKDDVDCAHGQKVGDFTARRCEPVPQAPYADISELARSTHGTFTQLPSNGMVDLTTLPLTNVLGATERCETSLPKNTTKIRCVYVDPKIAKRRGEVTVKLVPGK